MPGMGKEAIDKTSNGGAGPFAGVAFIIQEKDG